MWFKFGDLEKESEAMIYRMLQRTGVDLKTEILNLEVM